MLREARPTAPRYDAASDTLEVAFGLSDAPEAPGAPAEGATREVRVTLLLDAGGALAGVDAREAYAGAPVLLFGAHEDVARTEDVEARLTRRGDTMTLRVGDARRRARAHEPNPFVR